MNSSVRLNGIKTKSGMLTNEVYKPRQILSMNSPTTRPTNRTYEDKQREINGSKP